MNARTVVIAGALLCGLGGCSTLNHGSVGVVDTERLTRNWPKFQNYNNQFSADMAAIDASRVPNKQKASEAQALQARMAQAQVELAGEIKDAAKQVADRDHLQLIVTHQFVGYGGTDITRDVEKIMNITESASPSP
ncbi:MAG: hypothetical protein JOZ38_04930 [Candidatus Eremiobacteraeota bacterium]|nr:hypothetical protein [Candidatus Eremiobacteraeota bacterium]